MPRKRTKGKGKATPTGPAATSTPAQAEKSLPKEEKEGALRSLAARVKVRG